MKNFFELSKEEKNNFFLKLPKAYLNAEVFLNQKSYIREENGEKLLFQKFKNFEVLKLVPEKRTNLSEDKKIYCISEEDVSRLEKEFSISKKICLLGNMHYDRDKFIEDVTSNRDYKKFIKNYPNPKVYFDYDEEEIKVFFKKCIEDLVKSGKTPNVSIDEILFVLNSRDRYKVKSVFIEIEGALVGFSIGCVYNSIDSTYIALYTYSSREYRGLSQFLKVERAKLFESKKFIDAVYMPEEDSGVKLHKLQSSNPECIEKYYLVAL